MNNLHTPTVGQVVDLLMTQGFNPSARAEGCYDNMNTKTGIGFRISVTDHGSPGECIAVEIMAREHPNWDFETVMSLTGFCTLDMIKQAVRLAFNSMTK